MNIRKEPIVVEQTFKVSTQELWAAITQLKQMRLWFFENIPAFAPQVGFETQFSVKSEERSFLHMWKILEVSSPSKIVYSWKYKEYPGEGIVTFELVEEEDGSKLILTNEGLHTFPQDVPEFKRESCLGGWNYFIRERLKDYLETKVD